MSLAAFRALDADEQLTWRLFFYERNRRENEAYQAARASREKED